MSCLKPKGCGRDACNSMLVRMTAQGHCRRQMLSAVTAAFFDSGLGQDGAGAARRTLDWVVLNRIQATTYREKRREQGEQISKVRRRGNGGGY